MICNMKAEKKQNTVHVINIFYRELLPRQQLLIIQSNTIDLGIFSCSVLNNRYVVVWFNKICEQQRLMSSTFGRITWRSQTCMMFIKISNQIDIMKFQTRIVTKVNLRFEN